MPETGYIDTARYSARDLRRIRLPPFSQPESSGLISGRLRRISSRKRTRQGTPAPLLLSYTLPMRVLGIDCGTEYTGYGIVELDDDGGLHCLECGAIKLSPKDPMAGRLATIFGRLSGLIQEHRPQQVAIEDVFYAVNVKSALKLGQVRGVAMLAASSAGLAVAEYSFLSIKSAVVGYGKAEKE